MKTENGLPKRGKLSLYRLNIQVWSEDIGQDQENTITKYDHLSIPLDVSLDYRNLSPNVHISIISLPHSLKVLSSTLQSQTLRVLALVGHLQLSSVWIYCLWHASLMHLNSRWIAVFHWLFALQDTSLILSEALSRILFRCANSCHALASAPVPPLDVAGTKLFMSCAFLWHMEKYTW